MDMEVIGLCQYFESEINNEHMVGGSTFDSRSKNFEYYSLVYILMYIESHIKLIKKIIRNVIALFWKYVICHFSIM